MDDTRVRDVHVKLRIVASLRQNHYASDWNGITIQEKGFWTSVRRTVLTWWENKSAAMNHLHHLCEDANSILSRAIADHVAHKKEANFEERVRNPRSRAHKNANFIKDWASDMSEAIGTREQGMATQYVLYAGDIPTTSELDGIVSKMCAGVECARTFFPDVPAPKIRVRCAVGGAALGDDDDDEAEAPRLQQPFVQPHQQQYEYGHNFPYAATANDGGNPFWATSMPVEVSTVPPPQHVEEGVFETPFGTPSDDLEYQGNSTALQKQQDAL